MFNKQTKIKIGDTVTIKTGSLYFVVTEVKQEGKMLICSYWDSAKDCIRTKNIPTVLVESVEDNLKRQARYHFERQGSSFIVLPPEVKQEQVLIMCFESEKEKLDFLNISLPSLEEKPELLN